MDIFNFIRDYWVQITAICAFLLGFIKFTLTILEAIKCSLRNDILTIYDRCKEKREISKYQLQSLKHSTEIYFKLKGNSFVESLMEDVKQFKKLD